jgi:hypothetical protein
MGSPISSTIAEIYIQKGAHVGKKNFNVIKMHGTTIKKTLVTVSSHSTWCENKEHHNPNAAQPHISNMRRGVSVI